MPRLGQFLGLRPLKDVHAPLGCLSSAAGGIFTVPKLVSLFRLAPPTPTALPRVESLQKVICK